MAWWVSKLLLLFIILPLVELYLLLRVGDAMGFGPTVLMVLVTGALGALLARREGLRVLREWQATIARGQLPEEGLLGGVLVLVGGVLLIAPGVLTDVTGLLLLFPPSRRLIAAQVRKRVERGLRTGSVRITTVGGGGPGFSPFGGAFGAREVNAPPREAAEPRIRSNTDEDEIQDAEVVEEPGPPPKR